jgi:DNA invertase Pin-like site-specific DNA recombinase
VIKAVIYMRESDPDGVTYTFEYQEDDCAAYAAKNGYTVVASLQEPGQTGHDSLDLRLALKEVRRMVRAREVDVVLVWKYDRLARDFLDQAFVIREAKMSGVRVESATEPVPDGPIGWVMQAMHGGMSEQEWHKTRQRLQAGKEKRVAHGHYLASNRPPYGYAFANSKKTRLVPDPITAPIIVRMFDLLCSGLSCHEVARVLSREGAPTPTGKSYWYWGTIARIAHKPLYTGVAIAFRTRERTKYVTNPISGESGPKKVRVPGEQIVLPEGTVPALVTPEVAQRARQYVEQHRKSPLSGRVTRSVGYLLRGGFAVCGICGATLTIRTTGSTSTTRPIYRCFKNGHGLGIVASEADEFVWGKFVESVTQPGAIAQAIRLIEDRREAEAALQLGVLQSLLDENQEAQDSLRETAKLLRNETARARVAQQIDTLADEEGRMRARIATLTHHDSILTAAQRVLKKFSDLGVSDLASLDISAKRRMLFDFAVHVTVGPAAGRRQAPQERCKVVINVLSRANTEAPASRGAMSSPCPATS